MKQPNRDILKNVGPTVLFNMTGKFGKGPAMDAMNKAAGCFVMALQDMGGEAPDDPTYYQVWGQSCGLPSGESFKLLRNVMVTCGWVVSGDRSDGPYLMITAKGKEKAASFEKHLKPKDSE